MQSESESNGAASPADAMCCGMDGAMGDCPCSTQGFLGKIKACFAFMRDMRKQMRGEPGGACCGQGPAKGPESA